MSDTDALGPAARPTVRLSRLLHRPVMTGSGESVGAVDDVVVRLGGVGDYPVVTGLVAVAGGRRFHLPAALIAWFEPGRVLVTGHPVDMNVFAPRENDVLVRTDLLGHRLIDVSAAEWVHAHDAEFETTGAGWVLTRLDTRRPTRLFGLVKSHGGHTSRDWTAFEPLIAPIPSTGVGRGGRVIALRPAQIADLLEDASREEGQRILRCVHTAPEVEADVFEELDPEKAARLLEKMSDGEAAAVLGRMRADDAADTVVELRQHRRRRVLDLMPVGPRAKVLTLMGYNPASAGGLMSVDVASCPHTATAADALGVIAAARTLQPEALTQVHVLADTGALVGMVTVIGLLQAAPATPVAQVMDSDPVRVPPGTDLTDVALLMADYHLTSIPVVDEDDTVLGVVTVDDILAETIPEDWRRREPHPHPVREPRHGQQDSPDPGVGMRP